MNDCEDKKRVALGQFKGLTFEKVKKLEGWQYECTTWLVQFSATASPSCLDFFLFSHGSLVAPTKRPMILGRSWACLAGTRTRGPVRSVGEPAGLVCGGGGPKAKSEAHLGRNSAEFGQTHQLFEEALPKEKLKWKLDEDDPFFGQA